MLREWENMLHGLRVPQLFMPTQYWEAGQTGKGALLPWPPDSLDGFLLMDII